MKAVVFWQLPDGRVLRAIGFLRSFDLHQEMDFDVAWWQEYQQILDTGRRMELSLEMYVQEVVEHAAPQDVDLGQPELPGDVEDVAIVKKEE